MKISLNKILSHAYLVENDYRLILPKGSAFLTHRTRVIRRIYEQLPTGLTVNNMATRIGDYTGNTNWLSVTKMINAKFQPTTLLKGRWLDVYKRDRKAINSTPFILAVARRDTGKLVGDLQTTIDQVDTVPIKSEAAKPVLNVEKIIKQRNESIEAGLVPVVEVLQPETVEDTALRICETFASGLLTINEVCERFGLNYLQWIELCQKNEFIRNTYEQAIKLANMFNHSRHITMVDSLITAMLAKGKHETTHIEYERVFTPGKLHPEFVEKKRKGTIRDFTPGEVAGLKALLLRSAVIMPGGIDDLAGKSDDELWEIIRQNDLDANKTGLSSTE